MKSLFDILYPVRLDMNGNQINIGDTVYWRGQKFYKYTVIDLTPKGIRIVNETTYRNKGGVRNPSEFLKKEDSQSTP